MELHSPIYLIFLALALCVLSLARGPAGRQRLLLSLSYVFYLSWSPPFLLLLIFSSLLNFLLGSLLCRRRSSSLLWAGIGANILLLLLARKCAPLVGSFFSTDNLTSIWVPVGISFYTFQALGWLVDAYRGARESPSLLEFLLFMSLWPVILAGPICRLPEMLPQFRRDASRVEWFEGVRRIVLGMFMKIVLAGLLAEGIVANNGVDWGFDRLQSWSSLDVVCLSFGYGLFLFFDFAGYSHIAIGSGQLLGLRLRENFKRPFAATSPADFWARWHMSLSSWIRDYVFFPLAAATRTWNWRLAALVFSMIVFGAWHGLRWTFLLWGLFHGLFLVAQRTALGPIFGRSTLSRAIGWSVTFVGINLGWVLFRAGSLGQAIQMYRALFHIGSPSQLDHSFFLLVVCLFGGYLLALSTQALLKAGIGVEGWTTVRWLATPALTTAMFLLTLAWGASHSPFVYVQF